MNDVRLPETRQDHPRKVAAGDYGVARLASELVVPGAQSRIENERRQFDHAHAHAAQARFGVCHQGIPGPAANDLRIDRHRALFESGATSGPVMITAHGASDAKRAEWRDHGFHVVDGTCPLVRHAHEQLKRLVAAGYFPVVIGKVGHVEVRGLTEDFPEARVVDLPGDILKLPRRDRYGVISQTTQPIDRVRAFVAEIERLHPASEVRFVDTVCKPTKDRQSALRKLIDVAEVIVVVGGRESNNTRQLVETCRAAGRRAFHIERPEELRSEWFDGISVVGLTAGTSTLRETVDAVFRRLEEIARTRP